NGLELATFPVLLETAPVAVAETLACALERRADTDVWADADPAVLVCAPCDTLLAASAAVPKNNNPKLAFIPSLLFAIHFESFGNWRASYQRHVGVSFGA